MPEAINYLRGIIFTSLPKPFLEDVKVRPIPPFKATGETTNILILEENHKKSEFVSDNIVMEAKDLIGTEINDDFRIRAFGTTINLLCSFLELWNEIPAVYLIFEPILILLKVGSVKKYPKIIREGVKTLTIELENVKKQKLEYLMFEKKKPKPLKMYDPLIEVV